ncbi:hypothetical protein BH10ACI2_BH10ACI2_10250 [soil metagenome]
MRRALLLSVIALSTGVFILAEFYPDFVAMARTNSPGSHEPKMSGFVPARVPYDHFQLVSDDVAPKQLKPSSAMPISLHIKHESDSPPLIPGPELIKDIGAVPYNSGAKTLINDSTSAKNLFDICRVVC